MKATRRTRWAYCPACGSDLDTGWECCGCGLDWITFAGPAWPIRAWSYFRWRIWPEIVVAFGGNDESSRAHRAADAVGSR